MLLTLAILSLLCALLPWALIRQNLRLLLPPPAAPPEPPPLSVLIPARDEEQNIREALEAVLQTTGCEFEVVVLDDQSSDGTAAVVQGFAARDKRVRLEQAPPLPAGWNGKIHACHCLAGHARHPNLLFVDADVRLAPDALPRLGQLLQKADLVSGVPRQITVTFSEKLLIPLIHFVLLGYLPLRRMRASTQPALAAACGQFMMTTAEAYRKAGGHAAISGSIHDGMHLARLYRRAGLRTDLTDLTSLASCRMYRTNGEVWAGLAKNAHEGMGAWGSIFPMTFLLGMGQVAPLVLIAVTPAYKAAPAMIFAWWALALVSFSIAALRRFGPRSIFHPVGVLALLGIQWYARVRHSLGGSSSWKGRTYRG